MILVDKKVGETPLELLDRLRVEQPELASETLSYAGRLDPMAEGAMLVLVGEENQNREKYLGLDKEYVATFLVGVQTDTGDALGLIQKTMAEIAVHKISKSEIERQVGKFILVRSQKYPWFSGQTVDGIKLFDHYKAGNTNIERPSRRVEIKEVALLNISVQGALEIKKYIFESIGKVHGDFRQQTILDCWQAFFDTFIQKNPEATLQTVDVRLLVSSGTYIRGLTENFEFPTVLLSLKRTKIKM